MKLNKWVLSSLLLILSAVTISGCVSSYSLTQDDQRHINSTIKSYFSDIDSNSSSNATTVGSNYTSGSFDDNMTVLNSTAINSTEANCTVKRVTQTYRIDSKSTSSFSGGSSDSSTKSSFDEDYDFAINPVGSPSTASTPSTPTIPDTSDMDVQTTGTKTTYDVSTIGKNEELWLFVVEKDNETDTNSTWSIVSAKLISSTPLQV